MKSVAFVLAAIAGLSSASADIFIGSSGGMLTTAEISEDGSTITPGVRVFAAAFGEEGIPHFSEEPGFLTPAGTLIAGARVQLNITGAPREWNGSDFTMVSASTMTLEFGPASATTPGTDVLTPCFSFVAEPDGGLHDHPGYTLNNPHDGIYLLSLSVSSPDGLYGASLPFWAVFGENAGDEDLARATAWVEQNLAPTPGTAVVLGLAAAAGRRRRRRG